MIQMCEEGIMLQQFIQLLQFQLKCTVQPEDHVFDIDSEDQTLLEGDESMMKLLVEASYFIPEGLSLLEVLEKLLIPSKGVLLTQAMTVIPPG
jgi:hypothetical protein